MKKDGFTLIELLAVIVILAIIALIAIPIILNIIDDARKQSDKRSIELYAKAIENTVAKKQLDGTEIAPGTLSEEFLKEIEYEGSKVECEKNKLYSNGSIYLSGCKVNDKTVEYEYGEEVTDYVCSKNCSVGDVVTLGDKQQYFVYKNEGDKLKIISYHSTYQEDRLEEKLTELKNSGIVTDDTTIEGLSVEIIYDMFGKTYEYKAKDILSNNVGLDDWRSILIRDVTGYDCSILKQPYLDSYQEKGTPQICHYVSESYNDYFVQFVSPAYPNSIPYVLTISK